MKHALRTWLAVTGGACLLLAGGPEPAVAQASGSEWTAPRWMGDVTFVSANALLGGLTAGTLRKLEGGDFRDGFTHGALGGAVAYGGRRLAAQHFDGAGLLGRQVSAVGASVVRNAGEGRPALERLVFPVGPLHLHLDRSDGREVTPKVALHELAWTVAFALRSETDFDGSASLSAGAPVFRSPLRGFEDRDGNEADGIQAGGVIGLSDVPLERERSAFAHERVHVLQNDFASLIWSGPIEKRLMERTDWTRRLYRHVEVGVAFPLARGVILSLLDVDHAQQPAEIEAGFLDRRR